MYKRLISVICSECKVATFVPWHCDGVLDRCPSCGELTLRPIENPVIKSKGVE